MVETGEDIERLGMVDGEEVKVDTGQVRYPHLLPTLSARQSTSTLSRCPLSEWPPPFSSRKLRRATAFACHHKLGNSNPRNNGSLC
ncbi:hypothetical protein Nepgr_023721 [Nepenthes gracilis]|uniref:Uncharacterized protein n=1 Tax=Nepenthes gracilis TaxID=150966 RepID=A0AAD3T2M7_NEPGR|nr:hypothetical protein Nepgr_023721 [Nepenthes gracilis]